MRRHLTRFCASGLLLWMLFLPAVVEAQLNYSNELTYTITNGAITITGYSPLLGGTVFIPSTIEGLPVIRIGDNAFASCGSLLNVTIPDTVTAIGDAAFSECFNLAHVTIGSSVTSIGDGAFTWCISLTSLAIPDSVNTIGDGAFEDCTSLAGVNIPSGVSNIATLTFDLCASLTNITIPNSVISIASYALNYCTSLTNITIGEGVTTIAYDAFKYGSGLTTIAVDRLNPVYSSLAGVLFDKSQTILIQYPQGKGGSYTIPKGVATIGDGAFSDCPSLAGVIIPNGVTRMGDGAFSSCTSLTNATIADSVTNIGSGAFSYCSSLTSVTIPYSVTSIGDDAFYYCDALTKVYFQGDAPNAGNDVFGHYGKDFFSWVSDPATVYYLPGTTAWGTNFAGLPTMLWNAQVQRGSFGVRTNQFGFNITGSSNLIVVIEASINLLNQTWSPLQTNTLNGRPLYFSDPQWTNYPSRFYRVTWPQSVAVAGASGPSL